MRFNFLRVIFAALPTFFFANQMKAQQTLEKIDGWNAYVHLPDDYYQTGSATYPVIIFLPGIGEIGTNAPDVIQNGPGHFIASGDKMQFVINGQTVKPIVISLQPVSAWPTAPTVNTKIDSIVKRYRVDLNRIHLTGLSMGGWSIENYVDGYTPLYTNRIASMVAMSAPGPDNGNSNMSQFAQGGGKWWGFEGTLDYRKMDEIRDAMNNAVPGSARYYNYVGGHCCWNTWYDPSWKDTDGESIYTWMLKQSRGGQTNQNPIVNAGSDVTITLPVSTVSLNGVASDPDGTIVSYQWTKLSGPTGGTFSAANSANTDVTGLTQGVYQFQLKVTDNGGATAQATVKVTVNAAANIPPTVSAGSNQTITLPVSTVTLTGTASDSDGIIVSYEWTRLSGPSGGTFSAANSANTDVSSLTQGVYLFQLKVTDNGGATAQATVQVTVNAAANIPPVANAGADQSITLPTSSVSLAGTGSDADGYITDYLWSQVSGPSTASIINPSSANTDVTSLQEGNYQFQLKVTDNSGATATSTMNVTVNPKSALLGCGCDVTLPIMPDGGIYFTNGNNGINVKPGQKVCIQAGTYPYINIKGLVGTAAQPITIINCGGQVLVGSGPTYCISIQNSRFFRFTGTGTDGIKYGFKSYWPGGFAGSGLSVRDSCTNFEIDHYEGQNVENGILAKIDPYNCTPGNYSTGWVIKDISYHDTYIHNTKGEAYYIGNTASTVDVNDCNGNTITVEPVKIDGIKFYNNICDSTGWDGIQIAAATRAEVYNNRVTNYGMQNMSTQQAGIILGGKSNGSVYNNYVKGGTGQGMVITGYGRTNIYNNVIIDAGWDNTSVRQDALAVDDRPMPNNLYTGFQVYIFNNTVVNAGRSSIHIFNSYGTMATGNKVYNNLLVKPNYNSPYGSPYLKVDGNTDLDSTNNIQLLQIADANFVSANDYHLAYNSPAIDKGRDVYALGVTTDIDGVSRPQGNAFDVGAYEFKSGDTQNKRPVAHAGADQTITLPVSSIQLNGSGDDSDGTITSYLWTKISGPTSYNIVNSNAASSAVNNLVAGVYLFQLTVTDNLGAIGLDTMQVTVNAATNIPPVANAGSDQTITLPLSTITLRGSGTDADGTVVSYTWTKVSGPSAFNIVNSSSAVTDVTGLVQGTYQFKLMVMDDQGALGNATVQIIVNPAPNKPPVANAGSDQAITLPISTVSLKGSGTDEDGTVVSYTWTKVSGPSTFNIVNSSSAVTDVTGLVQGTYQFKLTVTDNQGASGSATVQIIVNPAANIPPVANAGSDQTITLPVNTVSLRGSGTDADGTVVSYLW
ncbi:MAG: tandem-95 repeat protein, partial [Bacteroidetes bacterium]|nr:tandem-95 repeat protein [Bacteroidota bacterium]